MDQVKAPWHYLFLLILAGESAFILPFVLPRVFRPTVLEVFNLDNIQLGLCFSIYGIVALASYLFGGPLADKYPPRKLIAIALWATALGGIVYASFPSYKMLKVLYGYWGFTTIFLFWAAMIKATRVWGGASSQGKAFGFLDGGRGMVGALFGTLGVIVFSAFLTTEIAHASTAESKNAFQYVILISSGLICVVGLCVWFFMKTNAIEESNIVSEKINTSQIIEVLRLPSIWLLMIIILCAYVGYKITDLFSLYAKEVMEYDKVESAKIGTLLLFVRPFVGVIIGLLADRSKTILWLIISFMLSFCGSLLFASGIISNSTTLLFFFSTLVVATGVYAGRSLYFAVMENGQIPIIFTGTAVGLISLIGYTPDIFAGPAMGVLLENSPGKEGHQHVFFMVSFFSLLGGLAAWQYYRLYGKSHIQ